MVFNGMGEIYRAIRQQVCCGQRVTGYVDLVLCVLWYLEHPNI